VGLRAAYLCAYAALAALGEALVARPALVWLRGQGLLRPVLPWEVPLGGWAFLCGLLLAVFTLGLAWQAGLGRRLRVPQHAAFLLLLALCLAVRAGSGEPRPPADPAPALLSALRTAAESLDRDYRGRYTPESAERALAQLSPPGFVRTGRALPLRARVLAGALGPQLDPLPGDPPGTIYLALSADATAAWLTALTLHAGQPAILRTLSGKPALIEARAGTHSLPGRDPLVPAYPGMRSLQDPRR
jgi:hypothetical protein